MVGDDVIAPDEFLGTLDVVGNELELIGNLHEYFTKEIARDK
jgi:hypothetical protein